MTPSDAAGHKVPPVHRFGDVRSDQLAEDAGMRPRRWTARLVGVPTAKGQRGVANLTAGNTATSLAQWPNSGSMSCALRGSGLARTSWPATLHRALPAWSLSGMPYPRPTQLGRPRQPIHPMSQPLLRRASMLAALPR
jgi:hypothetical protein